MTKLEDVLEVVNQGREALGMKPLEKLPQGVRGGPDGSVLSVALTATIDESSSKVESGKEIIGVWIRGPRARALAEAWNVQGDGCLDDESEHSLVLPGCLARFHREFCAGKWPDLEDGRQVSFREIKRRFGLDQDTVETILMSQFEEGAILLDESGLYIKIADAANEIVAAPAAEANS